MPDYLVLPQVPSTSAHPGGCYLCKCDQRQDPNTGALEPMLDTNVLLDLTSAEDDLPSAQYRQGLAGTALVICRSCVLEMASMFGGVSQEQYDQMKDAWRESLENAERLQDAVEAAEIRVQALMESTAAAFAATAAAPAPSKGAKA